MKIKITSVPLFVIFIVQTVFFALKITNAINWKWEWVLAPLWIPYSLLIIFGVGLLIYVFAHNLTERIFNKHG